MNLSHCALVSPTGLVESSTDDHGTAWLFDETMQAVNQTPGLQEETGGRDYNLIPLWTNGENEGHDLEKQSPYRPALQCMPRPLVGSGRGDAGPSFPGYIMDLGAELGAGGELRAHGTKKRRQSVCCFCQKAFSSPANLESHLRTHTGERPFGCSTCGKTFSQYWNLKIHKHIHTGERPYQCPYCADTFSDPSNLKKHQKRHHLQQQQ